jgi:hypothetical protein
MKKSIGLALVVASACGAGSQQRVHIAKAADLPPRTVQVAGTPSALLHDPAGLLAFASAVRRELEARLERYDVADASVVDAWETHLALISYMEQRDAETERLIARVRDRQTKPGLRATSNLTLRALLGARRAGGELRAAFRTILAREVAALPLGDSIEYLKQEKFFAELRSIATLDGIALSSIDPAVHDGALPLDVAMYLVFLGFAEGDLTTVAPEIADVCGAALKGAEALRKPDIWAARDVDLTGRAGLTNVLVSGWDTGADDEVYAAQLWTNAGEIPDNGLDDDGNGWVDDVHGVAHDRHAQRTVGDLIPLEGPPERMARALGAVAGFADMEANLDTPAASALRKQISQLAPQELGLFLDDMNQVMQRGHGTHVAGLLLRGNPAARLVVARIASDWRAVPTPPSIEFARARAREFIETADYLAARGVRVCNLSWGFTSEEFEHNLAASGAGGDPTSRHRLGLEIFRIMYDAYKQAVASHPAILFTGAVGNDNRDASLVDDAPGTFHLPNLIIVGAVDQAGEPANFTSFGPVDIYADGVELESFVPGGQRVRFSGSSGSAPLVAGVAAKILAVRPQATTAQLRAWIVDTADRVRTSDGKELRLLHPQRAFEAATK